MMSPTFFSRHERSVCPCERANGITAYKWTTTSTWNEFPKVNGENLNDLLTLLTLKHDPLRGNSSHGAIIADVDRAKPSV